MLTKYTIKLNICVDHIKTNFLNSYLFMQKYINEKNIIFHRNIIFLKKPKHRKNPINRV